MLDPAIMFGIELFLRTNLAEFYNYFFNIYLSIFNQKSSIDSTSLNNLVYMVIGLNTLLSLLGLHIQFINTLFSHLIVEQID